LNDKNALIRPVIVYLRNERSLYLRETEMRVCEKRRKTREKEGVLFMEWG
jgi:hypothetical protein